MADDVVSLFRGIKSKKQLLVGITGGIGSGKSSVAEYIRKAGFHVLSSDDIAKTIVATNADVLNDIVDCFGEGVLTADGSLNRKALADKVFGSSPEHEKSLQTLNALVHPYVVQEVYEQAKKLFEAGEQCVFNESALLFEAGLEECYDYIIVVDAPEDVRVQRVVASRGLTAEDVRRRIAAQMSAAEKVRYADFVVNNAGSEEEMKKAVQFLLVIVPTLQAQSLE